ncbi:hypothetical protein CDD83_1367 [Cordyceps sp. RAO-2017]|nr:hypothetical protein CDD83_1367 [Cordyceps sp. RAO-2017]
MQIFAVAALFVASVLAVPTNGGGGGGGGAPYVACPAGLYSSAQCCGVDVLGVADLDCHAPGEFPYSAEHFKWTCSQAGHRARCCVVPVLGQGVLCQSPPGIAN